MTQTIPPAFDEITASIVSELDPERVVLFGSHAWGGPGSESDIDLLVVLDTTDTLAAEARIGRDCRPRFLPMDVLVTSSEPQRRILERGRVLYDRTVGPRVG